MRAEVVSVSLSPSNEQLTDFALPPSAEDGQSYVFLGRPRFDTNFIFTYRHHPVVADNSWQDVRALARKYAEWGLMGVCMLAYTVYCLFLFYAFPARFVNKQECFFSLSLFSLLVIVDSLGRCRVKAAHSSRGPMIDLMRSPTVKQTAAKDKHR